MSAVPVLHDFLPSWQRTEAALNGYVLGQERVVRLLLASILAGGHALLVGPPGVAKTTLVEGAAAVLGLAHQRVQGTPDVLPGDILGAEILDSDAAGKRQFRFVPGPIFTNILLFDEINRTSPRTQSALLQAMQEREVAVSGVSRPLPAPFHVLASQNPLDYEGTYPLPEVQLDRFLVALPLGYPDAAVEKAVLLATTSGTRALPETVLNADIVQQSQAGLQRAAIGDALVDKLLHLVRETRPETSSVSEVKQYLRLGASARAGQALMLLTRAVAFLDGRAAPSPDDVKLLAPVVLAHRMALNPAALAAGVQPGDIVSAVVRACGL
jgi:MoxR-like ATPase